MIGGRNVCSPIEVSPRTSSPLNPVGSNTSDPMTVASICARALCSGPNSCVAFAVGTMSFPSRRNSSSPNRSLSRFREWLTVGCVTCRRLAAPVTLRSS